MISFEGVEMRITTKGRYALRAILYLVQCSDDKPVSVKTLSEQTCLSPEFLEQIFFRLRKAGIISSTRGPGGGFSFSGDPAKITINDIFCAVDEGYYVTPCADEEFTDENCDYRDKCIAKDFWCYTADMFISYFSAVTIQDVIDKKFPELNINHG
jgi:Rrf2 family iron-sulfur cluster assembly transcriptional regulator